MFEERDARLYELQGRIEELEGEIASLNEHIHSIEIIGIRNVPDSFIRNAQGRQTRYLRSYVYAAVFPLLTWFFRTVYSFGYLGNSVKKRRKKSSLGE